MDLRSIGLVSVLLILAYGQTASANSFDLTDFKKNSLLFKLKEKKAAFFSDIEMVFPDKKQVFHVTEKFNFNLTIGEYVGQEIQVDQDGKRTGIFSAKVIYLDDVSEIYQIFKNPPKCEELTKGKSLDDSYYFSWAPSEVYDKDVNYPILGPNVLWWIFTERLEKNEQDVTCKVLTRDQDDNPEKVECSIVFEKDFKIVFDFGRAFNGGHGDDDGQFFSMVPDKIKVYQTDNEDQDILFSQFNYFRFSYSFNPDVPLVSLNLPIGYGCERSSDTKREYPKVITNYGNSFELEYEVVFTYPETDANRRPDRPFDPDFPRGTTPTPDTTPTPAIPPKIAQKQITEKFFNKMYENEKMLINVVDTVNEFGYSEVPFRTIYDRTTFVNYDIIYSEEHKCYSYHLKPVHEIDFHYVQDLFINVEEFFYIRKENQFEYIGEYNVQNVPAFVFEKKISNFNKKVEKEEEDERNENLLSFFRNNTNLVKSDHATVIHYYPNSTKYWSEEMDSSYNVPMKIEIILFDQEDRVDEIAKLTVNFASFRPSLGSNDIYDLGSCIGDEHDYNWVLIQFDGVSEDARKYQRHISQVKARFKEEMQISPLRLGEILVDSDDTSIFVTVKLLETAQALGFFRRKIGLEIKKNDQAVDEFADSEELCARRCLQSKNCGAFSYCAELTCRLWVEPNFDADFDPSKPKPYDWEKISKEPNDGCSFGTRIVRYNERNHQSNREYLQKLESRIKNGNMGLTLYDTRDETFQASKLEINVQPGRRTAGSKLEDENLADERNHNKYNDLFLIIDSGISFNPDKVKAKKDEGENERLLVSQLGLSVWECQLMCINNEKCKSMSFCSDTDHCMLTTIENIPEIASNTDKNSKCALSTKKVTAGYHKALKTGLIKSYKEKNIGSKDKYSENICGLFCKNTDGCSSFDYCVGKLLDQTMNDPESGESYACYLHDADPANDTLTDEVKWEASPRCDHYTEKATHEYIEYAFVKLNDVELIGTESKISLDQCAKQCTEAEYCNSFDYCFEKNEAGHLVDTHCRTTNDLYTVSKVESHFNCSVYSKILPKKLVKKVEKLHDNPVTGKLTTFLSLLFLAVGVAIGFGGAYYVIKYYFVSY